MHAGQVEVALDRLAAALGEQFPQLRGLPVRRISSAGTVVAPIRVGDSFVARLPLVPSADVAARERLLAEAGHARYLAGRLAVEVPRALGIGAPFEGYPGLWSVWSWVDGVSVDRASGLDQNLLAADLAALLRCFHELPTDGQSWNAVGRGAQPLADSAWVRSSIERSAHLVDAAAVTSLWERALAAPGFTQPASRIHGDPMPGNLIVRHGWLAGLIDIAEPSFGDPASDLAPAWTIFDEPARTLFGQVPGLDEAAWERGRGWALEMAIGGLHYYEHTNRGFHDQAARTISRLLEA